MREDTSVTRDSETDKCIYYENCPIRKCERYFCKGDGFILHNHFLNTTQTVQCDDYTVRNGGEQ